MVNNFTQYCRDKVFKLQLCRLYINKYMIASTHITSTKTFTFSIVLVLQLLSRKVLFLNLKRRLNSKED